MKKITRSGFTLIELLVVITILGMLVGIGTFAFMASSHKGNDGRRKSDLANISRALEMYANDLGRYPTASNNKISGCKASLTDTTETVCEWGETFAHGKTVYMPLLPKDPKGMYTYVYERVGAGMYSGWRLYARLENTQGPDPAIPVDENGDVKVYNTSCSATGSCTDPESCYCNYVIRSGGVVMPTPKP